MKLESEVEMTLVPVKFMNELVMFIRSHLTHLQCNDIIKDIVQVGGEGQRLSQSQEQRIRDLETEVKSLHDKLQEMERS